MLCHGGRTWYYECFWSQHVHTVHVFSLIFQLFSLISPQAIHWCSQNSPWSVYKSGIMSPLCIRISLQKFEHVFSWILPKFSMESSFRVFTMWKAEWIYHVMYQCTQMWWNEKERMLQVCTCWGLRGTMTLCRCCFSCKSDRITKLVSNPMFPYYNHRWSLISEIWMIFHVWNKISHSIS
jgi:hypothetical protein